MNTPPQVGLNKLFIHTYIIIYIYIIFLSGVINQESTLRHDNSTTKRFGTLNTFVLRVEDLCPAWYIERATGRS